MLRNRVPLIVYVDLDLLPGVMHTADSAMEVVQSSLNETIGHYDVDVYAAPDDFAKNYPESALEEMERNAA